jgi:nucleotide-binding universal stress UspA family protein
MYKNILLPTDGSALAGKAVEAGIALAKATGARLTAMAAFEPFHLFAITPEQLAYNEQHYGAHARAAAQTILDALAAKAEAAGVRCDTVLREADQPYQAIIDVADAGGCDLIVIASHGRRGMAAAVLGSVTQKLLAHTTTPVLVYR